MFHDLRTPAWQSTPTPRTLYSWTADTENPVSSARRALRDALNAEGVSEEMTSDAVLALSELAANATAHATGPFEMTLHRTGSQLICEVHDQDPYIPPFDDLPRRPSGPSPDGDRDVVGAAWPFTAVVWPSCTS